MKTKNKKYFFSLLILLILFQSGTGLTQNNSTRSIIQRSMRDEMKRNINLLHLENMERPFFISYNIYDVKIMEIIATLGAIVKSDESRYRNHNVRLMVGDYNLNDENFQDSGFSYRSSMLLGSSELPLEDDYDAIRRSLWIATDNIYKRAVELFEHKKVALKQQTMTGEEANLDDFSRAPVVSFIGPSYTFTIDRSRWEKIAKEISGVFSTYPEIYSSKVRIFFYQGDMFLTNSEGTEIIQPLTLVSVQVNACTQAVDGEPLSNHISFYNFSLEDLPSLETMKKSVKTMADDLMKLCDAPVFDELYFGPVLLEGQASAEFFSQRLFGGKNGLIAFRRPVVSDSRVRYSDDETLDDRINLRILAHDLNVKALPGLNSFQDHNLIGSYYVDTEGVKPPPEITLVENGILKTLLSNRTPTPKVRESNAHQRPAIGSGYRTSSNIGPSVILISSSKGKFYPELKKELLQRAREEGLEYGILIRKLKPMVTGIIYYDPMVSMATSYGRRYRSSLTEPILVYRVYVEDGREELVRSVNLGNVSLSTLRHIAGATEQQYIYNTMATVNGRSGIPSSFIVPQALILEELEVKNKRSGYIPKLPVVSSPLAEK